MTSKNDHSCLKFNGAHLPNVQIVEFGTEVINKLSLGCSPLNDNQNSFCFKLWGPHVDTAWVHLGVFKSLQPIQFAETCPLTVQETAIAEKCFPMSKIGRGDFSVCLSHIGENESEILLTKNENIVLDNKIKNDHFIWKYRFIITSNWNDQFEKEGTHLVRRDPYARWLDFDSDFAYLPVWLSDKFSSDHLISKNENNFQNDFKLPKVNKLIIYELHCSTFTPKKINEDYFTAIISTLEYIKSAGFNAIEFMPIQEFGGLWGYNPRLLMAVHGPFGNPLSFRKLVQECHRRGLFVILDVVLNHGSSKLNSLWNWDGYGPNNNGGIYFEGGGESGWGRKFNFRSRPVREMIKESVCVFLGEYKVDSIRFDSAHNIPEDFQKEIVEHVKWKFPSAHLIAEITPEDPSACRKTGFDSVWMHSNYYDSLDLLRGSKRGHLISILKTMLSGHYGFKYQHEMTSSILGSHDQIGNRSQGRQSDNRTGKYFCGLLGGRGNWHAKAQCRMLYGIQAVSRQRPMLFMGGESQRDDYWNVNEPGKEFRWNELLEPEKQNDDALNMLRLVTWCNHVRVKMESLCSEDMNFEFTHENQSGGVLGFCRHSSSDLVFCVINFGDGQWDNCSYKIQTKKSNKSFIPILNTQAAEFGGWHESWSKDRTPRNKFAVEIFDSKIESSVGMAQRDVISTDSSGDMFITVPKWSVSVYLQV